MLSRTYAALARRRISAFLALTLATLLLIPADAKDVEALVKIARISGTVEVLHAEKTSGKWVAAKKDQQISAGWKLRTGKKSKTQLLFPKENVVILKENSVLTFDKLDLNGGAKLKQDSGSALFDLKTALAPGSSFEVETPAALATVRGTSFGILLGGTGEPSSEAEGDAASGESAGRKGGLATTKEPVEWIVGDGGDESSKHKGQMVDLQSNPLYKDNAKQGNNPLYEGKRGGTINDGCIPCDLDGDGMSDFVVGDLDGDGLPDLLVDGAAAREIKPGRFVAIGSARDRLGNLADEDGDGLPDGAINLGDLDGDGLDDLVVPGGEAKKRFGIGESLPDTPLGAVGKQLGAMAKEDYIDDIARRAKISKADAGRIFDAVLGGALDQLETGEPRSLDELLEGGAFEERHWITDPYAEDGLYNKDPYSEDTQRNGVATGAGAAAGAADLAAGGEGGTSENGRYGSGPDFDRNMVADGSGGGGGGGQAGITIDEAGSTRPKGGKGASAASPPGGPVPIPYPNGTKFFGYEGNVEVENDGQKQNLAGGMQIEQDPDGTLYPPNPCGPEANEFLWDALDGLVDFDTSSGKLSEYDLRVLELTAEGAALKKEEGGRHTPFHNKKSGSTFGEKVNQGLEQAGGRQTQGSSFGEMVRKLAQEEMDYLVTEDSFSLKALQDVMGPLYDVLHRAGATGGPSYTAKTGKTGKTKFYEDSDGDSSESARGPRQSTSIDGSFDKGDSSDLTSKKGYDYYQAQSALQSTGASAREYEKEPGKLEYPNLALGDMDGDGQDDYLEPAGDVDGDGVEDFRVIYTPPSSNPITSTDGIPAGGRSTSSSGGGAGGTSGGGEPSNFSFGSSNSGGSGSGAEGGGPKPNPTPAPLAAPTYGSGHRTSGAGGGAGGTADSNIGAVLNGNVLIGDRNGDGLADMSLGDIDGDGLEDVAVCIGDLNGDSCPDYVLALAAFLSKKGYDYYQAQSALRSSSADGDNTPIIKGSALGGNREKGTAKDQLVEKPRNIAGGDSGEAGVLDPKGRSIPENSVEMSNEDIADSAAMMLSIGDLDGDGLQDFLMLSGGAASAGRNVLAIQSGEAPAGRLGASNGGVEQGGSGGNSGAKEGRDQLDKRFEDGDIPNQEDFADLRGGGGGGAGGISGGASMVGGMLPGGAILSRMQDELNGLDIGDVDGDGAPDLIILSSLYGHGTGGNFKTKHDTVKNSIGNIRGYKGGGGKAQGVMGAKAKAWMVNNYLMNPIGDIDGDGFEDYYVDGEDCDDGDADSGPDDAARAQYNPKEVGIDKPSSSNPKGRSGAASSSEGSADPGSGGEGGNEGDAKVKSVAETLVILTPKEAGEMSGPGGGEDERHLMSGATSTVGSGGQPAGAKVPREILKSYFQTGDKPTQQQFAALIDSCLAVGDLNGDGMLDYALLSSTGIFNGTHWEKVDNSEAPVDAAGKSGGMGKPVRDWINTNSVSADPIGDLDGDGLDDYALQEDFKDLIDSALNLNDDGLSSYGATTGKSGSVKKDRITEEDNSSAGKTKPQHYGPKYGNTGKPKLRLMGGGGAGGSVLEADTDGDGEYEPLGTLIEADLDGDGQFRLLLLSDTSGSFDPGRWQRKVTVRGWNPEKKESLAGGSGDPDFDLMTMDDLDDDGIQDLVLLSVRNTGINEKLPYSDLHSSQAAPAGGTEGGDSGTGEAGKHKSKDGTFTSADFDHKELARGGSTRNPDELVFNVLNPKAARALTDLMESDTDGDGLADWRDDDCDGDGIQDRSVGDVDGDGVLDVVVAIGDVTGDGKVDFGWLSGQHPPNPDAHIIGGPSCPVPAPVPVPYPDPENPGGGGGGGTNTGGGGGGGVGGNIPIATGDEAGVGGRPKRKIKGPFGSRMAPGGGETGEGEGDQQGEEAQKGLAEVRDFSSIDNAPEEKERKVHAVHRGEAVSDEELIALIERLLADSDGDGVIDYLDPDDDGDGVAELPSEDQSGWNEHRDGGPLGNPGPVLTPGGGAPIPYPDPEGGSGGGGGGGGGTIPLSSGDAPGTLKDVISNKCHGCRMNSIGDLDGDGADEQLYLSSLQPLGGDVAIHGDPHVDQNDDKGATDHQTNPAFKNNQAEGHMPDNDSPLFGQAPGGSGGDDNDPDNPGGATDAHTNPAFKHNEAQGNMVGDDKSLFSSAPGGPGGNFGDTPGLNGNDMLAIGDLDGDGLDDFVMFTRPAYMNFTAEFKDGRYVLRAGVPPKFDGATGDYVQDLRTFVLPHVLEACGVPVGDLDGDGRLDMLLSGAIAGGGQCGLLDSDNDGLPDCLDDDDDADGIADHLDPDDDGDGVPTIDEDLMASMGWGEPRHSSDASAGKGASSEREGGRTVGAGQVTEILARKILDRGEAGDNLDIRGHRDVGGYRTGLTNDPDRHLRDKVEAVGVDSDGDGKSDFVSGADLDQDSLNALDRKFKEISGLESEVEVIEYKDGDDSHPHKRAGKGISSARPQNFDEFAGSIAEHVAHWEELLGLFDEDSDSDILLDNMRTRIDQLESKLQALGLLCGRSSDEVPGGTIVELVAEYGRLAELQADLNALTEGDPDFDLSVIGEPDDEDCDGYIDSASDWLEQARKANRQSTIGDAVSRASADMARGARAIQVKITQEMTLTRNAIGDADVSVGTHEPIVQHNQTDLEFLLRQARDYYDEWQRYERKDQTAQMLVLYNEFVKIEEQALRKFLDSGGVVVVLDGVVGSEYEAEFAPIEEILSPDGLPTEEFFLRGHDVLLILDQNSRGFLPAVQDELGNTTAVDELLLQHGTDWEELIRILYLVGQDAEPIVADHEQLMDALGGLIPPGDPVLGIRNLNIDTDNDGLPDIVEIELGTDPGGANNDGFIELVSPDDGDEVDVATDPTTDFEFTALDTDSISDYTLNLEAGGRRWTRKNADESETVDLASLVAKGGAFDGLADSNGQIEVHWSISARFDNDELEELMAQSHPGFDGTISSSTRTLTLQVPAQQDMVIVDLNSSSPATVNIGDEVHIIGSISEVSALGTWEIRISYDDAVLRFDRGSRMGIFSASTVFFGLGGSAVVVSGTAPRNSGGVSGEGDIFELVFVAQEAGELTIEGDTLTLSDSLGNSIEAEYGESADVTVRATAAAGAFGKAR